MILTTYQPPEDLDMKVMLAHSGCCCDCLAGRLVDKLANELKEQDVAVLHVNTAEDAHMMLLSDSRIQAVLLDWDMEDPVSHQPAMAVVRDLRARNQRMPLFLFTDRESASQIPVDILSETDDFIWLYEDTADFIAGRILAALRRYRAQILPPMFNALVRFAQVHEYSWHTPGHTGGTAFLKNTVGRAYFDYFGENLLRSDLSISVGELGSLLDHTGPIGEGEDFASRVFGSDYSMCVTNGSSMSNRVIMMACVASGQVAFCDRNAHKSIEHAMTMSGATPTYMQTTRNYYGLIGPIAPRTMAREALAKAIADNPLVTGDVNPVPVLATVTNSTYDGLCYNVEKVEELLGQSVDRLHFDEAWYGYARFNPMYAGHFAMHGDPKARSRDKPSVFATQSTHKLLAALSQASLIHVREGRRPISKHRFNETYMMHASTSPNYAIIASNDVAAGMMAGGGGKALTDESIHEAVAFRRLMGRINAEMAEKGEWFFNVWQPDTVVDRDGRTVPFWQAGEDWLSETPACWTLKPGDAWHGFADLEEDWCMLDPIKVSVTTPGMGRDGRMEERGIPAAVVSSYLDARGIVVEKTTDFTMLFLFSIGITKGKWGTLVNALLRFREDYEANAPLREALPPLYAEHGDFYEGMGLRDLCDRMFATMKELNTTTLMAQAFSQLPRPDISPRAAYERLVLDKVEVVGLDAVARRSMAAGVVPYPPGIPLLMPGENAGADEGAIIGYLRALERFDNRFPGFGHDNHGVEVVKGKYMLSVLKD